MSHWRVLPGNGDAGFDASRSLVVIPIRGSSNIFLVSADGLAVSIEDPTIATVQDGAASRSESQSSSLGSWERQAGMRRVRVRAVREGSTVLHARRSDGRDWTQPLTVRVVADPDARQAADVAAITPELRRELQGMGLRDAVLRVAEDQMNSHLGRTSNGTGRYLRKDWNWCGAFAHWCWKVAAAAKGVPSPFGPERDVLLSPQKAIDFVCHNPDKAVVLRYHGSDPMNSRVAPVPLVEIGASNPVLRADICLVRNDHDGWQHVALVHHPPVDGPFRTLDGNQGNPSIRMVSRKLDVPPPHHPYKYAFVHVKDVG